MSVYIHKFHNVTHPEKNMNEPSQVKNRESGPSWTPWRQSSVRGRDAACRASEPPSPHRFLFPKPTNPTFTPVIGQMCGGNNTQQVELLPRETV